MSEAGCCDFEISKSEHFKWLPSILEVLANDQTGYKVCVGDVLFRSMYKYSPRRATLDILQPTSGASTAKGAASRG